MPARHYNDWILGFMDFASVGEAPPYVYFWVGVSTIAGALRRRVWLDMGHFKWLSNFYVILVAPPGIIAKSTSAGIGMNLLRRVKGIKLGPDVVTWQALVQSLGKSAEAFEYNSELHTMSAITIESSELGNLLNPQDREMVDMLVNLWDGKQVSKMTKTQGSDEVINPWVNIIGCTTPSWISNNFPEYMIGGGFMSRCIFIYAEEKHKYVAYPSLILPTDFEEKAKALVEDLEQIAQLTGPFTLTPDAYQWGINWYEAHWKTKPEHLDVSRFGGYLARKQTHIHKLAMILSVAQRNDLIVRHEELERAATIITSLESTMPRIFDHIGRTEESRHSSELVQFVRGKGEVEYKALFKEMYRIYPTVTSFEAALAGAERAGFVKQEFDPNRQSIVVKRL